MDLEEREKLLLERAESERLVLSRSFEGLAAPAGFFSGDEGGVFSVVVLASSAAFFLGFLLKMFGRTIGTGCLENWVKVARTPRVRVAAALHNDPLPKIQF